MKHDKKEFLRPQMRRVFRAASWLVFGRLVIVANSFIVSIWIARHLGPADYGVYSYILTLANLAGPLLGFGLSNVVLRDIKIEPEQTPLIMGSSLTLRLFGTLIASLIAYAVTSLSTVGHPHLVAMTVILFLSFIPSAPRGVEYHFNATDRQQYFVIVNTLNIVLFGVAKIWVMLAGGGIEELMAVTVFETAFIGLLSLIAYRIAGEDFRLWRISRRWLNTYFRRGGMLMAAGFGQAVVARLDVIMVAEIVGVAEAGIYAAASRISQISNAIPTALAAAVFPRLLEMEGENETRSKAAMQDVLDVLAAAAICLAVSTTLVARPVIEVLLGDAYASAAAILVIHIWVCVFSFTRAAVDNWLISRELDRLNVSVHGTGVVLSVALNLLLIPLFGGVGAAIATVGSYALASMVVLGSSKAGRPILLMVLKAIFTWPLRLPRLARRLF